MGILIGMDEAGYGPHLGPLVVAATAWEVADDALGFGVQGSEGKIETFAGAANGRASAVLASPSGAALRSDSNKTVGDCPDFSDFARKNGTAPLSETVLLESLSRSRSKNSATSDAIDLYRLLRNIVAKSPSERRIAIADSKALYHPGQGLRQLERGLHAVLLTLQQSLACWSQIVDYCRADPDGHHKSVCWPDGFDCALPVDAGSDELTRLAARFTRACNAAGVRPLAIRAKLVFPEQFNNLVAYYNSKGAALSHVTVGLLREMMDLLHAGDCATTFRSPSRQNGSVYAVCDKHGGRNFYTALLQHHFCEHWIEPVFESHAQSRYEWGPPEGRVRVVFRVNGETFLPTALASMTAKYLRELAMRAFNTFWSAHVPDLRPTAGYYRDSWRFKKEIAAKQRELGIDDHVLWRER